MDDHDYSAYVYLAECVDGCGAITEWLSSSKVAREAAANHSRMKGGHKWQVRERMRE